MAASNVAMVADIAAEVSSYKMQSDLTLFHHKASTLANAESLLLLSGGTGPAGKAISDSRSSRQGGWNRSGLEQGRFTSASTSPSRSSMRPRNVIVRDKVGKVLAR